jgi:predicted ATPase
LSRSDLRNLLLIGAFRDNEVTAAHPLMRKLEAIRATGRVQDIKLAPLATNDLGNLVADSLRCDAEQADPLAALVHAKTDGNPFFVIQFLHVLSDERLLAFDHERGRWSWDMGGIQAKRYTDNVVELLAGKLTRLPLDTQCALRQLACLGNVADVAILSVVLEMSEERVHAALSEALRQQLIERAERSYRFIHDRVQEAAYALIPEASRAQSHLTIGRLLLAQTSPEKREEAIFEIVNQLNRGTALITSHGEREQLAELNLVASKRAKASSAYASALVYITAGATLLPEDAWERRQDLAFELELHRADCEVYAGALQAAEDRLAALTTRTVGTIQRCAAAQRRVDLCVGLRAGERAVGVALECLRYVGIDWSAHPTEVDARSEYERIWSLRGGRTIEDLVDLPLMKDPEARATLDVLTSLALAALYTDKNLYVLTVCKAVNLSLEHGNSEASPLHYAATGMIAGPRFGHYDEGYRFGRLACDLIEFHGLTHFGERAYVAFAIMVPWTRPLSEGIEPTRRGFQMAKDHGDPTYASIASRGLSTIFLALGRPLDQFEREAEVASEFVQRYGFFLDSLSAPIALARNLRGKTTKFGSLDLVVSQSAPSRSALRVNPLAYSWSVTTGSESFRRASSPAITCRRSRQWIRWRNGTRHPRGCRSFPWRKRNAISMLAFAAPHGASPWGPTPTPSIEKHLARTSSTYGPGRRIVRRTSRIVRRWSVPRSPASRDGRLMRWNCTNVRSTQLAQTASSRTKQSPTNSRRGSMRRAVSKRLVGCICETLGIAICVGEPMARCGSSMSSIRG